MIIMVTGGRGFIGSHFVELLLREDHKVYDYDAMTYSANRTLPFDSDLNYVFSHKSIESITHLPPGIDWIVNFAAESHVDNSISSPTQFLNSNTIGVYNLLELLRGKTYDRPKLLQISTDEVYGDTLGKKFVESDVLSPSNPYAATKAAAEQLIFAYGRTYGINYRITRSTNNYGSRQYPEKLIPHCMSQLEKGDKIHLHGDGTSIRDWIRVEDNVAAIYHVIKHGIDGEIYNIGADNPLSNNEVAEHVCGWYGLPTCGHVEYVEDRLGQDERYAVDTCKIESIGWKPPKATGLIQWQ